MKRLLVVLFTLAAGSASAQEFPPGPMHDTVEKACTQCHGAGTVTGQAKTRQAWADTVTQMIANGAQVSDTDFDKVVDYLATNFPAK